MPRHPRAPVLAALILLCAGWLTAGCSQHSFLDDFPPYPPTEPFLEERAAWRKRVAALEREKVRRQLEYEAQRWEKSRSDWRQYEFRLASGELALRDAERRKAQLDLGPIEERIDEWKGLGRRSEAGLRRRMAEAEYRARLARRSGSSTLGEWEALSAAQQRGLRLREAREAQRYDSSERTFEEKKAAWDAYLAEQPR